MRRVYFCFDYERDLHRVSKIRQLPDVVSGAAAGFMGVASILDLLDAQSQQLAAELSLANAISGFLRDAIAAERAISFYAFLEPPLEVGALLDQVLQKLGRQP